MFITVACKDGQRSPMTIIFSKRRSNVPNTLPQVGISTSNHKIPSTQALHNWTNESLIFSMAFILCHSMKNNINHLELLIYWWLGKSP